KKKNREDPDPSFPTIYTIYSIYKRTVVGVLLITLAIYFVTLVTDDSEYAYCIVIAFIGGMIIWFDLNK
ncbi:MAG: hypothetical protein KAH91_02735, partial [Thermoplasmatales archaeon]|nr:hypothetical protein [Thermoplasmatales archaeon]